MITRLNIMLAVLVLSLTGGAVGIKGTDGYTASIGNAVALDGSTEWLSDTAEGSKLGWDLIDVNCFSGYVCEFLAVTNTDSATRTKIETYLKAKWGTP